MVFYKTIGFFSLVLIAGTQGICNSERLKGSPSSTSYPAKQSTSFSERARFVNTRKRLSYRIYRNDFCVGV